MQDLLRQRELLRMEYNYEKAAYRREAEVAGVAQRVRRGDCWYPVSVGRSYYNSLDRLVVEITRTDYSDIEHNFEYGRTVCFFEQDASGMLRFLNFVGTVSYADPDSMVVTLGGEADLSRLRELDRPGVAIHFDETTYRLMFEALERVIAAKGNRLAALRDIFHGAVRPSFRPQGSETGPRLQWLNRVQEEAVGEVLRARDVMVVHGPPGTGKTTTLVEAVVEVLKREPQVMVCAQSNTAVDWISSLLTDRGVSVLRIGNPARVTDKMLACTYERRFEAHPDYPTLWAIRRSIRQLYATPRKSRGSNFHQKIARLRERADELELRIRHALFDGVRVVASTLAGAAHPLMAGQHFHTLFIDEAAQALEAACWIAIAKADRVVFAGDHCQLPPTVKCPEALRGGLGRTLMERIAGQWPEAVRLLTVQYRMNEELMRFSSEWFYGGQLQAAPEVSRRSLLDEMDWPLVWVETGGTATPHADSGTDGANNGDNPSTLRSEELSAGRSRINREEAQAAIAALRMYVRRIGRRRLAEEQIDIGIISPYRAQVQLLRSLLRGDESLRPLRRHITVNTVDAFQGQERDVVLVSLVRANESGQIGFLSDLRRMNVAMTRARMKLIIVGDPATLCRHRFYKKLHERCHVEAAAE